MNAIPPWVWLAGAAALPTLLLGALAIGACIGGTKISREHTRPTADERGYGPDGHDQRWDEEPAPGTGPRRGRQEAL